MTAIECSACGGPTYQQGQFRFCATCGKGPTISGEAVTLEHLVQQWRHSSRSLARTGSAVDYGFSQGYERCANELEAWLRDHPAPEQPSGGAVWG